MQWGKEENVPGQEGGERVKLFGPVEVGVEEADEDGAREVRVEVGGWSVVVVGVAFEE